MSLAYRLRLLSLDRWHLWPRLTRYRTRTEDAEGGNTVVVLTARAWYDAVDFEAFLKSIVVCTLTEAELGEAGS